MMSRLCVILASSLCALVLLVACHSPDGNGSARADTVDAAESVAVDPAQADTIWLAGGCFWCMEPPFDRLEGVARTVSGFAGGTVENPSYRAVASGQTDHTETVQVIFDAETVDIERILYVYWRNVDPLDGTGQFCDRGLQYRPEIFVSKPAHRQAAEASKADVQARFDQPIAVDILDHDTFYAAEDYHQNYYQKNPGRYNRYREGCRRDARLEELWGAEANPPAKTADASEE